MTEQNYLYKCPNFTVNLNNMRLNNKWCDVTIRINGKELRAHKVILAANLKYFDTMLSNDSFQESQQNVITMEGIEEADLEAFLSYAYTGEILLTEGNALDVLVVANYLSEDGIKEACIKFLEKHLKKEEACRAYNLACSTIDFLSLKNVAKETILSNFGHCSQTTDYLDLDFEHLTDIFSDGKKQPVELQRKFFEGIMKWIMHDAKERRIRMDDLLNSIDIAKLTADYLMKYLCAIILDHNDEYEIVKNVMLCYHSNNSQTMVQQVGTPEQVLAILGRRDNKMYFQCCNLTTKKWSRFEEVPCTLSTMSPSVVLNNKAYFIGKNSSGAYCLNVFDPTTKQISTLNSSSSIHRLTTLCTCGRFLYICGGIDINVLESGQVLRYDPLTDSLETLAPMRNTRYAAAAIFYQNCIHVLGGASAGIRLNSVEKYDSNTNEWTSLPPMSKARSDHAAADLEGKLYACGGHHNKTAEVYDPLSNTWQPVASMSRSKSYSLMVAHGGELLAVGGNFENTVEAYNPRKDEWQIDQQLSEGLQLSYPLGGLIAAACIANAD